MENRLIEITTLDDLKISININHIIFFCKNIKLHTVADSGKYKGLITIDSIQDGFSETIETKESYQEIKKLIKE